MFPSTLPNALHIIHLRRAAYRRHRKCARCRNPRIVCTQCARMWCPTCYPTGCEWKCTPPPVVITTTPPIIPESFTEIPGLSTTKADKSHKKKPSTAPVVVKWPGELRQLATAVTALGLHPESVGPTDIASYPSGKWTVVCVAPLTISVPKFDDFPNGGRRIVAYETVQTAKGVRITVVVG